MALGTGSRGLIPGLMFSFFLLCLPFLGWSEVVRNQSVSVLLIPAFSVYRNPPMGLIFMRKGKSERHGSATPFMTL